MPRRARVKSSTGIYHIMLRGINRKRIFEDDEDKIYFLKTIKKCKAISEFNLYAYCLMGNHIHLLIKENTEQVAQIMKRIGARYVYWYNKKYERVGHLFQDRFKSEAVENDIYLLVVLRYIMQNPLKAGLCSRLEDYKWSSYDEYTYSNDITDTAFILNMLSSNIDEQKTEFLKFVNKKNNDKCLDIQERSNKLSDENVRKMIKNRFEIDPIEIKNIPMENQIKVLKFIKKQEGISLRQIARITGLKVNKVFKA